MIGEATLMYYCDACTAELVITLTRTGDGWVNDTADKQLAVEGWRTLTTAAGIVHYCDTCGPDIEQSQLDERLLEAEHNEFLRQEAAELARLDAWNQAARSFVAVHP